MDYTQNAKISQVSEQTLILGVDVGSEVHFTRAFNWRGIELSRKPFHFTNDAVGFQSFLRWADTYAKTTKAEKVLVGCEPTGHYFNTFFDCCVRGNQFDAVLCLGAQRKGMVIMMNEKDYIEINRASYDIVAEEYKTKYKNNDGAKKFYELLQEFVLNKKNSGISKMLEIGPGVGTLLSIFEEKGFRTTAVELSKNMASLACEKSSNSVIINGNILETDFMPKQFDFILAMAVIHNFPEVDLIKLLDKIKIWLKDDGCFILDTTNNKVTETGYFEKEDYNNNVVRYRRKWKKENLESFMHSQGFYIQDSVVYKDSVSKKEWLIYSFKVDKNS